MLSAPLVNFLIAGVQKGGTTALFDYLAEADDIALSRVKEVHFFDDEEQDWSAPDYDAYHAQFEAPGGRPCGEATPIYCYWPQSLERIARYNPAMRLILLLRDPVERAWSHWRMEHGRGFEKGSFSWCIREGRDRLIEADRTGRHRQCSYVERGFYADQLERAFGLFGRERVLVLKSEDLRADPAPALASVRSFLSLPPAAAPPPRESHVGADAGGVPPDDEAFLRAIYAADAARVTALTGIKFPGGSR